MDEPAMLIAYLGLDEDFVIVITSNKGKVDCLIYVKV